MVLNIHQKIGVVFAVAALIISMYDVLFHFLLWLMHILFECVEFILDHLIESLFEIGNRETEIVVFYLLLSLIGAAAYQLYHLLPLWKDQCKEKLEQQKTETLTQWQELSVLGKMAWWSFFLTAVNCWLFLS